MSGKYDFINQEGWTTLFITNNERTELIVNAVWPYGIETGPFLGFFQIRNDHPLYEDLVARYVTPEAYNALTSELFEFERIGLAKQNRMFTPPSERIYLYPKDGAEAKKSGAQYDHVIQMWFITSDHPNLKLLKKIFCSKNSNKIWLLKRKIKLAHATHLKNSLAQVVQKMNQYSPPAKIKFPPRKRGVKKNVKLLAHLTLRMFCARFKKGIINDSMTQDEIAKTILTDLVKIGHDVTISAIKKQIFITESDDAPFGRSGKKKFSWEKLKKICQDQNLA